MQLFGVLTAVQEKTQDRLLKRAAERIVEALALTEYDNETTALALKTVLFTEDPVERLIEFRELRGIINTAGNKWSTEGAAQMAQASTECPQFIKDAMKQVAKAKNVEVHAVDPEHLGEAMSHLTDLSSRLGVLSTARDELESTVALRTGLLTWQDFMRGTTVPS